MPWSARDGVGRLGPGIPKSDSWASDPQGIEQVGCVYTMQGFEVDYVGAVEAEFTRVDGDHPSCKGGSRLTTSHPHR
jgi:hypothetical protein